ncbi:uncharacterized protein ACRADG_004746 [Cochliomyia hominivorax]
MKFVFAVVLLALAVGVQSSLVGLGPWGLPWGGAAIDHSAWGGPLVAPLAGHGLWGGIPGIALAQGPALGHAGLGLGLGVAHGGPGVYVAKTRGAVHTAPLAGHLASATAVNVAPAPGTH